MNRLNNTPEDEPTKKKLTAQEKMALSVIELVRKQAVDGKVKLTGQIVLSAEGVPPYPMVFCCQPGGSYMCWMVDPAFPPMYKIYALVNEKFRHLGSFPIDQLKEFQDKVTEIQKEMGEE